MLSLSNLAELETHLDRLVAPDTFTLSYGDMERLFPKKDCSLKGLERFAIEHGCMPIHWHGAVIFEKLPPK
jgi:hypothetical protein